MEGIVFTTHFCLIPEYWLGRTRQDPFSQVSTQVLTLSVFVTRPEADKRAGPQKYARTDIFLSCYFVKRFTFFSVHVIFMPRVVFTDVKHTTFVNIKTQLPPR